MSALLYQLTASAAHMCLPVPVPAAAPDGWLEPLVRRMDHWQTLGGNIVGGAIGIVGALIVAVQMRRRERRVAAGMVLPDLQQLDAAGQSYEKMLGDPPDANMDERARAFFEKGRMLNTLRRLSKRRPVLFALHTPSIGQLSDVDVRLYSHLFQCQMVHREFEDLIASRRPFGDDPLDMDERDLQRYTDWKLCVEHAALARYFLERLVFPPLPVRLWHRCRMKWRRNVFDERSAHLIKHGEMRPPANT